MHKILAALLYVPWEIEVGSGWIRSVGVIIVVKRTETALVAGDITQDKLNKYCLFLMQ